MTRLPDKLDDFIDSVCERPGMWTGTQKFFPASTLIDGLAIGRGGKAYADWQAFRSWLAEESYKRFKEPRNYGWQYHVKRMFPEDRDAIRALPNLWRLFRQGGTLRGVRLSSLTKTTYKPNIRCSAVFLDLQGTLGGDGLGDILDFEFYPFAVTALRLLKEAGLRTIVITNQSHIAKGKLTYDEYLDRVWKLERHLERADAMWDAIYCCPHQSSDNCDCQKPKTGLIVDAVRTFGIDLPESYVVGDMGGSDMLMAHLLRCKGILVRTGVGEGSLTEYRHTWAEVEPDFVATDVLEAAQWIVNNIKKH